jgi:spore maturation protein CgeB
MKFLKVSAYYAELLNETYSKKPALHAMSYQEQMNHIFGFGFGWSNFWKQHLEATGKFSVEEIIYNVKPAQTRWAEENKISYNPDNWQTEILDAQIDLHKPEIIFFEDLVLTPVYYKKKFQFVKFIITWDGIAHQDVARYEGSDVIASCHKGTVDFYKNKGVNSFFFLFGFETSLLSRLQSRPPLYDLSFVGSVNVAKNGHRQRLSLLSKISKQLKTDYWVSGTGNTNLFSFQQLKRIARGMIPEIFQLHQISKFNRGKAYGMDMYQILSDSKITLNTHIDAAGEYAANVRLFEATGTGTCLLTDWKKNLHEIFEIDKEVVAYKSPEECIEKVKWLLANESERKKIATAGQHRTINQYSLQKRITGFIDYIGL